MKAPEISRPLEARRSGPLKGVALVPGDKSISHRALILGALAVGETKISGLLEADDVLCTAAAMRKLGVTVLHDDDGKWRVTDERKVDPAKYGANYGHHASPSAKSSSD